MSMNYRQIVCFVSVWLGLCATGFSQKCPTFKDRNGIKHRYYAQAYLLPEAHYYTSDIAQWRAGIMGGANIGMFATRKIAIQAGAAFSQRTRIGQYANAFPEQPWGYRAQFLWTPVEVCYYLHPPQVDFRHLNYVIAGVVPVFNRVTRNLNYDLEPVLGKTYLHDVQTELGIGFSRKYNRQWQFNFETVVYVSPLSATGISYSRIHPDYLTGFKMCIMRR